MLNVVDGSLFAFGQNMVSRTTVLPVLVTKIGGDNVAVSLLGVIWVLGFYFPQVFIAGYAQRVPEKKRLVLLTAFLQRIPWLLLAIVSFLLLNRVGAGLELALFFAAFALAAVTGSLNLPGWFDLVAKITPVGLRGRLFASRAIAGGLLGVLAGWIAVQVLSRLTYPQSFGLLFALAFVVMMGSYAALSFLVEDRTEVPSRPLHFRDFFARFPEIIRTERNYRNYLVAEALLMTATIADAFYTVNAFRRFHLSAVYAGRFTIVFMVGAVIGSLVFGTLADRVGHRVNLIICAASTALACLVAITAANVYVYCLAFVGSAFAVNLLQISRLPFLAEVCGERDRPTYVALASMVTSPFVLLGLGAGWVANRAGYAPVFIIIGAVAACAALWLIAMVQEPRRLRPSLEPSSPGSDT
ncbi:MAG TPA: MFS transporter [Rhodothermales bacterium]|nr:MFS transporter [Rhodothermales bacterium]